MPVKLLATIYGECLNVLAVLYLLLFCGATRLTAEGRRKRRQNRADDLEMRGHQHKPPDGHALPTSLTRRSSTKDFHGVYNPQMNEQLHSALFQRLPFDIRQQILEWVLPSRDNFRKIVTYHVVVVTEDSFTSNIGYKRKSIIDRWRWPLHRTYIRFSEEGRYSLWQPPPTPGILTACRRAHAESIYLLYAKTTFVVAPDGLHGSGLSDCIELLDRFGDRTGRTLIKKFVVTLPVGVTLHECRNCEDQWERMWRIFRSLKGLRELQITLKVKIDISGTVPSRLWAEHGVSWLGNKLLSLPEMEQVTVCLPKNLMWMIPDLESQTARSNTVFKFAEVPPGGSSLRARQR